MTGNLDTLLDSKILERARRETLFGDRLYEILVQYQNCQLKPKDGERIGALDMELTDLYNRIWHAAFDATPNTKRPKRKAPAMIG
jgi:hypothetical protein